MPVNVNPAVVLFDANGVEMNVANGVAIPVNTRALLIAGTDVGGIARHALAHTDGALKTITRGGAKGSTVAADITSSASGADHQAIDVAIYDAAGNQITTFGGGQQYADGTARGTATGTLAMVDDGVNIQSISGDTAGRLNVNAQATAAAPAAARLSDGAAFYDATKTGQLPAALVGGRLDENIGAWLGSTAPTVGQKAMAASIPVVFPSDQLFQISQAPSNSIQDIAFGKIVFGGGTANNKYPIRRTTYTAPTTGAQRSLSSLSANDTNTAGTGARQVKITYYDSGLTTKFTETVNLNGTTPVNTTNTNICFIEKMEVVSVGSVGNNVGVITLFSTTAGGGTVVGSITTDAAGSNVGVNNRTYWAHHYVRTGKVCFVQKFSCGAQGNNGNQGAEVFLASKDPTVTTAPNTQVSDSITVGLNAAQVDHIIPNTIKVTGPAFIVMTIIPAGNGISFYGSFDFWEDV